MAEDLTINHSANKEEKYDSLYPQLEALIAGEKNKIANLANIAAALKETFNWWWVGFYLVDDDQLVLGPFQGPVACTRIALGKGVCGSAWKSAESIVVPDVEKFPGHIACSSLSVSEIVVPVFNASGKVVAVIDVDSEIYDVLDDTDRLQLEKIAKLISPYFD